MIFNCPPDDPWIVVLDQPDYMVWSYVEDGSKVDITTKYFMSVADKYTDKNLIKLKASVEKSFAKSHDLKKSQTVVRVKNSEIVWTSYMPTLNAIKREIEKMGSRKWTSNLTHLSQANARRVLASSREELDSPTELEQNKFRLRRRLMNSFRRPKPKEEESSPPEEGPIIKLLRCRRLASFERNHGRRNNPKVVWNQPNGGTKKLSFLNPIRMLTRIPLLNLFEVQESKKPKSKTFDPNSKSLSQNERELLKNLQAQASTERKAEIKRRRSKRLSFSSKTLSNRYSMAVPAATVNKSDWFTLKRKNEDKIPKTASYGFELETQNLNTNASSSQILCESIQNLHVSKSQERTNNSQIVQNRMSNNTSSSDTINSKTNK